MDFRKAFDYFPGLALFQRLHEIGISDMLQTTIMRLYERVTGRLRTSEGFFVPIQITVGVKQRCPPSPTLFGL